MIVNPAKRLEHISEYYFSIKLKEIAQLNKTGKDIINLGIGKPDLAPPQNAIGGLNDAANIDSNHGYQSYVGVPELRDAFANWYQKFYKIDLNANTEILPLIGSKEGIMHISMSFLEPGDQVLVPNPGYPAYSSAARISGAEIIHYDLLEENDYLPDLKALERSDLSQVKLMWINYPHMPTGAQANAETFSDLVQFCLKHKILLCHDNPYSFILNEKPESIFSVDGAKDCALELNSLSKSHNMSGWRVGMLAGAEEYLKTVLKFKSNMDSGMFKALQMGAVEALQNGEEWFQNLNSIYAERREKVREIMNLLDCKYLDGQAGMFQWGKIPDHYTIATELTDKILYEANVFLTPGIIFGNNGNRYIRISLCQPTNIIETALNRIRVYVGSNEVEGLKI